MNEIIIEADYYDMLEQHLRKNPQSSEIEMVTNEVKWYEDFITKFENEPVDEEWQIEGKRFALVEYKKYLNYFKDRLRILKLETPDFEPVNNPNQKPLKLKMKPTELVELVKALLCNGNIIGLQKDAIKAFSDFFNVEVIGADQKLQNIKSRNNGNEAKFLDALKLSLLNNFKK